ncbi:hypothetical protein [Arcanobacterium pinnipediorum]|uniref:Uncharacterized protein n=1 Tax=Arcanobacterium pinnipediorum TaxID=1503041 RepID=A0ABY5AHG2_9ACTO|nr:hypothetical protein [Arcanobacterium pinnipediorum]USR78638.1 hypothetical protein NG665_04370 [Arcanobacterium pinnipediorum]
MYPVDNLAACIQLITTANNDPKLAAKITDRFEEILSDKKIRMEEILNDKKKTIEDKLSNDKKR